MKYIRLAALAATLFIVFLPSLAVGEPETLPEVNIEAEAPPSQAPGPVVIVPDVPPPAGTDWQRLVMAGAAALTVGVALAKKASGKDPKDGKAKLRGIYVYPVALVLGALIAGYQVGVSDPKMLAKHIGQVVFWGVGGPAFLKQFLSWIEAAKNAWLKDSTIPPPPPIGDDNAEVILPPSLPPRRGGL